MAAPWSTTSEAWESAGEAVVHASELADVLKLVRELLRLLGKKSMEAEILKEAVEVVRS